MQTYHNSREHIFDELRRLDLRIRIQIEREKSALAQTARNDYRGLVLTEEEIEVLWSLEDGNRAGNESKKLQDLLSEIRKLENEIETKLAGALEGGVRLSLLEIKWRLGLSTFDVDVILVCLAPELDLKYSKLYAYLQNDITSKRPTIDLVFRLFCETADERVQARTRFTGQAPLFKHRLIDLNDEENASQSFLSRALKIDERIVRYLLDIDILDESIAPFSRLIIPAAVPEEVLLPAEEKASLMNIFGSLVRRGPDEECDAPIGLIFHGPSGVGKKFTAEALCGAAGLDLLVANLAHFLTDKQSVSALIARLFREAQLRNSAIYFDHADVLMDEQETAQYTRQALLDAIEAFHGIVFLSCEKTWKTRTSQEARNLMNVDFPRPDFAQRGKLWRELLAHPSSSCNVTESDIDGIAGKFQFTAGRIRQVMAETTRHALVREGEPLEITAEDLYRACRSQSTTNLADLAQKIKPLYKWDDIVLPKDTMRHLKEISLHVKHRQRVFADWKFDGKISLGKGISVLFAGPPGTGKTMAAEIIANELGLELYKIDLSSVVSKYIGETEKNLSRIFEEAEQSNAILFFDEADALFGKRSEIKDSHDRYANVEVNYLLQKMEEYEGFVILASNFQKNIDEAFTRRLRFIVEIPFPDRNYRARIWRNIFPAETPRSKDIEFDFLAGKFEFSGGHIKNIALGAAFLAAENSGIVNMKHIISATKREYQKMGRMFVKADYGQYYELLEND
jgi:SpoVK/Ycf46/Vps4 family AAA+-type ATPase